jgi:hypothetical protein
LLPIILPVTTVHNSTTVLNKMQANTKKTEYICRFICRWSREGVRQEIVLPYAYCAGGNKGCYDATEKRSRIGGTVLCCLDAFIEDW